MPEKFTPTDGRPLTPHEREILTILQEECAEVIVAASKLLRFGYGNTNPSTGKSNIEELSLEVGDLSYMISLAGACSVGLVTPGAVAEGRHRKSVRLLQFMQTEQAQTVQWSMSVRGDCGIVHATVIEWQECSACTHILGNRLAMRYKPNKVEP